MMFVPGCVENPIAVVHTDACTVGWGYVSGSERHHGAFSDSARQKHINYKETITVLFALRRFAGSIWYDCRVLVRSDNTTTVALVNAKCHLLPHLEDIAAEMRLICAAHNLDVQAQHVPGVQNVIADQLSRLALLSYTVDWRLHRHIFEDIDAWFGPHTVDGMATKDNTHVAGNFWTPRDDFMRQNLRGHNVGSTLRST